MRSTLGIFIFVLVVMLAGTYSISWYMQAWQVKSTAERFVAALNAKQQLLTYDTIETSGFPSTLYLTIIRPHLKGRVDTLLPPLPGNSGRPEWNEDAQLDGRITLGINALSDHYTMRISGSWLNHARVAGQTLASSAAIDIGCELRMERRSGLLSTLWNLQLLPDNMAGFLQELRLLDCTGGGYTIADPDTHETLVSSGPARWYVTNNMLATQRTERIYIQWPDLEITQKGNWLIAAYLHETSPQWPSGDLYALGKMALAVDFSAQGTADFSDADMQLNTLEWSAAPYGISGKGSVKTAKFRALPVGAITLDCRNCAQFIDDALSYDARLPATSLPQVNPQRIPGIKGLLTALAQPGNGAPDFHYSVENGSAGLSVNGKRLEEIIALYNQFLPR